MKRHPLTGKKLKNGDEYRIHVDADGNEHAVPDTEEWRAKSYHVSVFGVYCDGIDEMATGVRIWVVEDSGHKRPVCVRPRGRDWALAEGGLEYTPLWSRRRDWALAAISSTTKE